MRRPRATTNEEPLCPPPLRRSRSGKAQVESGLADGRCRVFNSLAEGRRLGAHDSQEYVLRGAEGGDSKHPPCISTPCVRANLDAATTRVYLFASVLGWFKEGYVDVTGTVWGAGPIPFGSRGTFTTTLDGGRYCRCNYIPVIEQGQVGKALAFLRQGRRLRHVHEPYSFLSFFKVVESGIRVSRSGSCRSVLGTIYMRATARRRSWDSSKSSRSARSTSMQCGCCSV